MFSSIQGIIAAVSAVIALVRGVRGLLSDLQPRRLEMRPEFDSVQIALEKEFELLRTAKTAGEISEIQDRITRLKFPKRP